MARVNNLSNFLTDVASAIKTKKGSETAIPAANFDTEILALPSQGVYQTKTINITTNGIRTITPDQDFDAIEQLNLSINVPIASLQTKSVEITSNGLTQVLPDVGYDGFSQLSLNVNIPTEDLTAELNAQDILIQQLQQALENKTAGATKVNIYCQLEEPTEKEGIWLQTNKEYEEIIEDSSIYASEEWNVDKMSDLTNIPYRFFSGSAVAIGTDAYLFGGSGGNTYAYKYNTLTDTYTRLTDIPYRFFSGSAVAVGTDVYLFGGIGNNAYAYKYNTLTDTYTQLINIPYLFYSGETVVIGTDIYLFGSYISPYSTYAYKYNTLTDTYTRLTNIPYPFYNGSAVAVGTDVYLFATGDNSYGRAVYKYNTLTGTYASCRVLPYIFTSGSAVAIGTDIYLFGSGNSTYSEFTYKYNALTDTYTQLTNIPYPFYSGSAVAVGTDVYLFGGEPNKQKVQVMTMQPNIYTDESIVIANNKANRYETILVQTEVINGLKYKFDDVFYYKDEEFDVTIPTYYGNGTEWVKFKN